MGRPRVGAWYRSERDAWYAYFGGKKVSLGVSGRGNHLEAQEAYFRLLETGEPHPPSEATAHGRRYGAGALVGDLIPAFMADAETRLSLNTVRIYRYDLERFAVAFSGERVSAVKADALTRWLRALPVGEATKRIAATSVSAFFGWCVRQEHIDFNPFRRVAKPRSKSRAESAVITPEEHERMLASASPQLRDVLSVLHATGCRPGEACRISVENYDPVRGIAKLTDHKTATKTGKPRLIVVPSPSPAAELLAKLAAEVGRGPLLRTAKGNAWTSRAITERMKALAKRTGIRKFAYGYRHTFVTDALSAGTSEAITAALVGHTSTAMIHQFYSALGSAADVLRKAASLVRGGAPEKSEERQPVAGK